MTKQYIIIIITSYQYIKVMYTLYSAVIYYHIYANIESRNIVAFIKDTNFCAGVPLRNYSLTHSLPDLDQVRFEYDG